VLLLAISNKTGCINMLEEKVHEKRRYQKDILMFCFSIERCSLDASRCGINLDSPSAFFLSYTL
jgi:hypothetical protein